MRLCGTASSEDAYFCWESFEVNMWVFFRTSESHACVDQSVTHLINQLNWNEALPLRCHGNIISNSYSICILKDYALVFDTEMNIKEEACIEYLR